LNDGWSFFQAGRIGSFRFKLASVMMAVVVVLATAGSYVAERNAAAETESGFQGEFNAELRALEAARETRISALTLRCLSLVGKARIHAALEDDALDLLYLSARDELRDLMTPASAAPSNRAIHATFYRFLNTQGEVIPMPNTADVGELTAEETTHVGLSALPAQPQLGYLRRVPRGKSDIFDEMIATAHRGTRGGFCQRSQRSHVRSDRDPPRVVD